MTHARVFLLASVIAALAACGSGGATVQSPQACSDKCPSGMVCAQLADPALNVCVYTVSGVACAPGQVVVNGACAAAQRRGRRCASDGDCGAGYQCRADPTAAGASVCWPALTDISGTIEGTAYVCDAGETALGDPPAMCLASCGGATCPPAQACAGGVCAPIDPLLRGCAADADCASDASRVDPPLPTYYCARGRCLPRMVACNDATDCPSGFDCGGERLCVKAAPPPDPTPQPEPDPTPEPDPGPQPCAPLGCKVDGCDGTQACFGGQPAGPCQAPRRCPDGWGWNGSACEWSSPFAPQFVKYYPHRAANEAIAATGPIGFPAPGGAPGPIYVEVHLEQWSTPPAAGGGNHCGKGDHVSAWVGCVHGDGGLGWGRDVADREWESQEMIPLRCDPGDTVGVFKHTWGHDSSWHCTRQLGLRVIRNHDPIDACRW